MTLRNVDAVITYERAWYGEEDCTYELIPLPLMTHPPALMTHPLRIWSTHEGTDGGAPPSLPNTG